jgi:4-amino-4-deoxy-L-arabinose transferase-like glycosyltransferase
MAANETAARLPSLFASVASIALVYALGKALYGDEWVGLLAALLLALSPFDILFVSTAFTDPLMTALVLGALLAAARGHLGAAGLLAGLAAATKQQGLFFLPPVVAVGVLRTAGLQEGRSRDWRGWAKFVIGIGLVAGGVIWWDAARMQRPGFWEQGLISYGGLEPAQAATLAQRAAEWLQLVVGFWVSPWFGAVLLAAIVVWLAGGIVGWWPGWREIDLALAAFCLGFLLLHWLVGFQVWDRYWLVGFQVWDRYLLALVPLVALLAARAFVALGKAIHSPSWRRAYIFGLALLLAASLAVPVWQATRSELPYGGDHGAYDGIDELAAYLRAQAPPDSVLYHYWLGYHHRFYLHGTPLRQHWYPDVEDLAHDATVYRREPRYIAFPTWQDGTQAQQALAAAGIQLSPILETSRRDGTVSFQLYRLEGPGNGSW